MELSIKSLAKLCGSFFEAVGRNPQIVMGAALVPHIPAAPAMVTLKTGERVPAPIEGVNVYDPTKEEFECAEVHAYIPPQPKNPLPRMTEEEAARWCP